MKSSYHIHHRENVVLQRIVTMKRHHVFVNNYEHFDGGPLEILPEILLLLFLRLCTVVITGSCGGFDLDNCFNRILNPVF